MIGHRTRDFKLRLQNQEVYLFSKAAISAFTDTARTGGMAIAIVERRGQVKQHASYKDAQLQQANIITLPTIQT